MKQIADLQVAPVAQPTRGRWLVLAVLVALNLVVWLDELKFSQLSPFWSSALHLDATQTASILSAYYIGYAPALLVAGFLADRFGPRPLLIVAAGGVTALSVAMVGVTTAGEMFWRNAVFGVFFGFVWAPSNRMIANWFDAVDRTRATSIWLAGSSVAGVLTPIIALPIAKHVSWQAAFVIVAMIGLPALIALFWTPSFPRGHVAEAADRLTLKQIGALTKTPSLWIMTAVALLAGAFALSLAWSSYGLITMEGVDPDTVAAIAPLFGVLPVIFAFANGAILIRLFRGRTNLYMATGLVLCALGYLAASALPLGWVAWAFCILLPMSLANSMFYGTLTAYWSVLLGARATGTATGLATCAQIVSAYVLVHFSGGWFDTSAIGLHQLNPIFIVGGVLLLVGAGLTLLAKRITIHSSEHLAARH
ncbi:MFS transporter [Streptomyces sp. NPDC058142]|uniref:MFS transporter n=1 Tax=Streptomyces sp. NPDC058142 TaxID=3346355 RepID=UPI0036EA449D